MRCHYRSHRRGFGFQTAGWIDSVYRILERTACQYHRNKNMRLSKQSNNEAVSPRTQISGDLSSYVVPRNPKAGRAEMSACLQERESDDSASHGVHIARNSRKSSRKKCESSSTYHRRNQSYWRCFQRGHRRRNCCHHLHHQTGTK